MVKREQLALAGLTSILPKIVSGQLTTSKCIEEAITIIEDLRTKIINPDLRTSYFATVQDYYQLKIDLLMQLHEQQPTQGYNIQDVANLYLRRNY